MKVYTAPTISPALFAAALFNVSPSFARDDRGNVCLVDAELTSQTNIPNAFSMKPADCPDVALGQFGCTATLATGHSFGMHPCRVVIATRHLLRVLTGVMTIPTRHFLRVLLKNIAAFGVHIARIVRLRADEQMIRANTGGVVTVMQHPHTVWNRAERQYPGGTVREAAFPEMVIYAVPAAIHGTSPQRAIGGRINTSPEMFGVGSRSLGILCGHSSRSYIALGGAMLRAVVRHRAGDFCCHNYSIFRMGRR